MTFDEILTQVVETLQRQGRVSYGALKRRFTLDDDYLWDLKEELISAQRVALDENGKVLVWVGREGGAETEKQRNGEAEKRSSAQQSLPTLDSRPLDSRLSGGERRRLTILCCGLSDPSSQGTMLESEDLTALLHEYQTMCATAVARYDGHVAQYLSDGVLVYFGYPVAHEDDAHRAVLAGLEIVETIRGQETGDEGQERRHPLQVRIGIHTGVVILNIVGDSERQDQLALGETPRIAARVQELADANRIVVSAATHRLVMDSFVCESLGARAIEGLRAPVPIYRVTAKQDEWTHQDTPLQEMTLPLVGREEELRLLLKRWEQVQEGYGQVVLLSGEAGIGKSRLVRELRQRLAAEGVLQFAVRCSAYHQQSAFYPLIDLFQRAFRFAPEDSSPDKLDKIERGLSAIQLTEALPLVAAFLALPTPHSLSAQFPPQKLREQIIHMIVRMWLVTARQFPLVLIWEDLQWADPSTLALLQVFLDQIPTARIFAVVTFRPDFVPPWTSRSYVTPLMLDRLGQEHIQAIIGTMAGRKTLPAEVMRQIVAKTDGVPLFVEELTKMVLESGLLIAQDGHYLLNGPLPPLAIPTTLQDSLLARLDRLGEAREIAQLGAVFGRGFSYPFLKAVVTLDEENLQQGLAKLVKAEVLHRRGIEPQVHYLFKHALIQEAAYQSLLKSQRQQYHQRVAQMFAERVPETQRVQPELLAHHYSEAGLPSYALPYWQRAGQHAIERSAFTEAVGYLTKGRTVLAMLPETPERTPQELELYIALGSALMAQKSYSAPEVEQTYAHALALCRRLGETPRLLQALSGLTVFYLTRAELRTAREIGDQCLSLAQQGKNPVRLLQALVVQGNVLFYAGEFSQARERLDEGLALYHRHPQGPQQALQDPGVSSLCYLALSLWLLGYPEQARQKSDAALALAQQLNRPLNHVIVRVLTAGLCQFRREPLLAFKHAELATALASEQDLPLWTAYGKIFRGWALAQRGEGEDGLRSLQQGIAMTQDTGAAIARPWQLLMLAESYLTMNCLEEGLTVIDEALGIVQRTEEGMCEAELYRLRGELSLRMGERETGRVGEEEKIAHSPIHPFTHSSPEACFLKAIEVADRQQAKMWELRATMSLARLWHQQGKRSEAQAILTPVYVWFTEGAETTDLQEAKKLLAALTEASGNGVRNDF
jgi:class 3 adenylate cyclase/predicted ATPase